MQAIVFRARQTYGKHPKFPTFPFPSSLMVFLKLLLEKRALFLSLDDPKERRTFLHCCCYPFSFFHSARSLTALCNNNKKAWTLLSTEDCLCNLIHVFPSSNLEATRRDWRPSPMPIRRGELRVSSSQTLSLFLAHLHHDGPTKRRALIEPLFSRTFRWRRSEK